MNELMDYFGTAVNVAARIQKESRGGDFVVTEEVWADPHVQEVLRSRSFQVEEESCTVRGLSLPRKIYRIQPV
jgi:class 3 adenylate cyclase